MQSSARAFIFQHRMLDESRPTSAFATASVVVHSVMCSVSRLAALEARSEEQAQTRSRLRCRASTAQTVRSSLLGASFTVSHQRKHCSTSARLLNKKTRRKQDNKARHNESNSPLISS
jgi:hypothetical protein